MFVEGDFNPPWFNPAMPPRERCEVAREQAPQVALPAQVAVRLADTWRNSPSAIASIPIRTGEGAVVPFSQVAKIELLMEEMAAADPDDAAVQYALNRRFHQAMVEPCGNPILLGMLEQLWDNPLSRRITRSYIQHRENVPRMVEEHREILQASLSGDCERLVALVIAHIREGYGDALTGPGRIEPDSSGARSRPGPGLPDTKNSFIPTTSST